jgi:CelD/BcsL family acetyltransferase involved in cellulose biosynthesis
MAVASVAVSLSGRSLARAASEAMPIRLQIFTNLAAAEPHWRGFEQTAEYTVFQTFDWSQKWYDNIGISKKLTPVIILGSVEGGPCFLFPLAIERVAGVRSLVWLGVDLADYNAPLLATKFRTHVPPGQFAPVWEQIISLIWSEFHFDVVELDKMPAVVGSQSNPFCDLPVLVAEYSAHATTLAESWGEFYPSKISSTSRQTDRRKLRRLAEHGDVRFVQVEEPQDIKDTFAALVEQKRASYARMGVADMFERSGHFEFYSALATHPLLRSIVHLTRVDVGDVPVATGLGLRFKSRYYLILHSYKEEYAKYSPGTHHIHYLLQYAISQRMRIFDFTIGDESYKNHWSDIESPLLRFYQSRTIRGKLVVAFRMLRHHAAHWYKRLYKDQKAS